MRALASLLLLLSACSAGPAPDGGVQRDAGPLDGGVQRDAGSDGGEADAGAGDSGSPEDAGEAPTDAGAVEDAGRADAGTQDCNADAVRFEYLASGPLEEGVLCDEVFVCAANAGEEARITAASAAFTCTDDGHSLCGAARACFYADGGPGLIDAAALAEICAVTLVTPTPDVVCVVYGP